jgi:hypothetical protein
MSVSCKNRYAEIIKVEKAQLRNTLREGRYQFNAELILDVRKDDVVIGFSELDVTVNQVYLGKAIIGAETLPLNKGRQRLPFRLIFPDSLLVLTTPNTIELSGYLTLNQRKRQISWKQDELHVMNLTGM